MAEFTIVERTEPFTLDEVFSFIDDTNISKTDAHELKSRIVDMVQAEKSKAIDEFANEVKWKLYMQRVSASAIDKIAEELKGGAK